MSQSLLTADMQLQLKIDVQLDMVQDDRRKIDIYMNSPDCNIDIAYDMINPAKHGVEYLLEKCKELAKKNDPNNLKGNDKYCQAENDLRYFSKKLEKLRDAKTKWHDFLRTYDLWEKIRTKTIEHLQKLVADMTKRQVVSNGLMAAASGAGLVSGGLALGATFTAAPIVAIPAAIGTGVALATGTGDIGYKISKCYKDHLSQTEAQRLYEIDEQQSEDMHMRLKDVGYTLPQVNIKDIVISLDNALKSAQFLVQVITVKILDVAAKQQKAAELAAAVKNSIELGTAVQNVAVHIPSITTGVAGVGAVATEVAELVMEVAPTASVPEGPSVVATVASQLSERAEVAVVTEVHGTAKEMALSARSAGGGTPSAGTLAREAVDVATDVVPQTPIDVGEAAIDASSSADEIAQNLSSKAWKYGARVFIGGIIVLNVGTLVYAVWQLHKGSPCKQAEKIQGVIDQLQRDLDKMAKVKAVMEKGELRSLMQALDRLSDSAN